jgi:hypothetical protein
MGICRDTSAKLVVIEFNENSSIGSQVITLKRTDIQEEMMQLIGEF